MAPARRITPELIAESLAQANGNKTKAALLAGCDRRTLQRACNDPAIAEAMKAVGTNLIPSTAWVKTTNSGVNYSVMLKPQPASPTEMAEAAKETLKSIKPCPPPKPKTIKTNGELLTLYPLMDVHFGMLSWKPETGSEYDTTIASDELLSSFASVAQITPNSAEAILLVGGDFFHADDNRSETPANRHKLDVDSRHWKVLDRGIRIITRVLSLLSEKHQKITVRVLRGNHDEHSHLVLSFALSQYYRLSPSIVLEMNPMDLFAYQWGQCLIAAHHGDRAPPERLTLYISDVCKFWSDTRHRYCFVGHKHSELSKDVGPLRWEQLRAFCPHDSYAAGMGYAQRRAMQAIVFDKKNGIILRAIDPINHT